MELFNRLAETEGMTWYRRQAVRANSASDVSNTWGNKRRWAGAQAAERNRSLALFKRIQSYLNSALRNFKGQAYLEFLSLKTVTAWGLPTAFCPAQHSGADRWAVVLSLECHVTQDKLRNRMDKNLKL